MEKSKKKLLSVGIGVSCLFLPSTKVFATIGNKHISMNLLNVSNKLRSQQSANKTFASNFRRSIRRPSGDVSNSKYAHSYYKEAIRLFNEDKDTFNSNLVKVDRLLSLDEAVSNTSVEKLHLDGYTMVECTGGFIPNIKVINDSKNIPRIPDGKITSKGFIGESPRDNSRYNLVKVKGEGELEFMDHSQEFIGKIGLYEEKMKSNFPGLFSNDSKSSLTNQEKSLFSLSRAYSSKLGLESLTNEDLLEGDMTSKNAHTLFKSELIVGNDKFIKWINDTSKEILPSTDRKILTTILNKIWMKGNGDGISTSDSDGSISSYSDTTIKASSSLSSLGIDDEIKSLKSTLTSSTRTRSNVYNNSLSSIEEGSDSSFSIGDRSSLRIGSKKLKRLESEGRVSIYNTASDGEDNFSSSDSASSFKSLQDHEPSLHGKGYVKVPGTDNYMEKMVYEYMDKEGFLTLFVEENRQISKVVEVSPRVYGYVIPKEQQELYNNMKRDLVVEAKNKLGQTKRVVIQSLTMQEDGIDGIYAYQLDQGLWREVVLSQNGVYYLGDVVRYDSFGSKVQGKLRKMAKLYNTFGSPIVGASGGISKTITGLM